MLVSIVAIPDVFTKRILNDKLSRRELEALLRGVTMNGVFLDDTQSRLWNSYCENIKHTRDELGPHLTILWAEILKAKKRYVIPCDICATHFTNDGTSECERLRMIAKRYRADAIVVTDAGEYANKPLIENDAELVLITDYRESRTESLRNSLLHPQQSLDKLEETERQHVVSRCVRYANRIAFYDYIIGRKTNPKRFLYGIMYFVKIWLKEQVNTSTQTRHVDIYTCPAKMGSRGFGDELKKVMCSIEKELCDVLRENLNIGVRLIFKDDPDELFHARCLEANGRAYHLDRGFDLFRYDQKTGLRHLMRNFLKVDPAMESHLADIQRLDTLYETPTKLIVRQQQPSKSPP